MHLFTKNDDFRFSGVILIAHLIGRLDRLETLHSLAHVAHVDVNCFAGIQHEAISLVHGGDVQWHLSDANVALALHLKQFLFNLIRIDVLEAAGNAAVHVTDACFYMFYRGTNQSSVTIIQLYCAFIRTAWEVGQKHGRLVILNFTVLNWYAAEVVIQFDSEDGGSAHFVLNNSKSKC